MKQSVRITSILITAILFYACKKSDSNPIPATTASASITTPNTLILAGSGIVGSANGIGVTASFYFPEGICIDLSGNIYMADSQNDMIRKISPTGVVTTLAGSINSGKTNATGSAASFTLPMDVAVDKSGNIYVADYGNNLIRKITPAGVVTTLAGTGAFGSINGAGTVATFSEPSGIAVDDSGNVYVADSFNNLIRKITAGGVVTTLAGSGKIGSANGQGITASFSSPTGITVDTSGNVYVTDKYNNIVRKITRNGLVTTLAGSRNQGNTNGTDTLASFYNPTGITADLSGNIYIADSGNNLIRKITAAGLVTTVTASISGGNGSNTFNNPQGIAIDMYGNLFICNTNSSQIFKINN